MAITVSPEDVTDSEEFIAQYLTDSVADGDYTDGALLRDLSVKAIAYIIAYLKKTDEQIRARQSLLTVEDVDTSDDEEAASDAVDAIISNWFASRNQGNHSRVVGYGHSLQRTDALIPAANRFYKTATLAFLLDNSGADLHIPAEDMTPQYDSNGDVIDYAFKIPLVAENPGSDYDVEPGNFTTFDEFSPYVTRIETLEKAEGGTDIETSTEMIDRSQNLVTVRNLINARSCDAVLRDEFEDIRKLSVTGMGDIEMIRDRIVEYATGLELHVGGHMDIYVDNATVETTFAGEVGGRFARPDGVINVFRDDTYADGTTHKFTDPDPITGKNIQVGMALRIWDGIGDTQRDYRITEVRETELVVSERLQFPVATDEESPVTYVDWSVGQRMPDFWDVVARQSGTGETSKHIQMSGRVTLPGGPLYAIKSVTIADDADPDADPADGLIYFYNRVNQTPVEQVAPDNEYQVVVHNPESHQSAQSYAELIVGTATQQDKYDGKTIKVTYDTLVNFEAIDTYVLTRQRRVSGESPLVRANHPIYLRFNMEYALAKSATTTLNETAATQLLVDFINSFDPRETLDVSTLMDVIRQAYSQVGRVYTFTIEYAVYVPDGRVVQFETTEDVVVPSTTEKLDEVLVHPGDPVDGLDDPLHYGLTDDVMRYLALIDDITITERL